MDYTDDATFAYPQSRTAAAVRPTIQTSRTNYSSTGIVDGLDAKVVVLGNSAVGKTSLLQRFTENKFVPGSTTSTTGAFFVKKKVVVDNLQVRLQLWDTAGQERFRSMAPMYYRGANAAILCYDITDASSFDDIRQWIDELKHYQRPGSSLHNHSPLNDEDGAPPLLIYIVGAKADLGSTKRAISLEQARRLLHTWYPPPAPARASTPPPPPPPSKLSITTITTASGLSYIRPRFTSLTSSLSAPTPPPPPPPTPATRPSPRVRASNSYSASPPTPTANSARSALVLARAKSARVVPVGQPLYEDRPAGAWRSSSARRPGAGGSGIRERRWSDAMMWDDAMREEGDGYYGGNAQNDTPVTDGTSSAGDDVDFEEEYPLEKGMALFEVSAFDGRGVSALFDHLLGSLIERRDTIQREKALRERNSVMLEQTASDWGGSSSAASNAPDKDGSSPERGGKPLSSGKAGGWSCCST